jgi:hypothetical protein
MGSLQHHVIQTHIRLVFHVLGLSKGCPLWFAKDLPKAQCPTVQHDIRRRRPLKHCPRRVCPNNHNPNSKPLELEFDRHITCDRSRP